MRKYSKVARCLLTPAKPLNSLFASLRPSPVLCTHARLFFQDPYHDAAIKCVCVGGCGCSWLKRDSEWTRLIAPKRVCAVLRGCDGGVCLSAAVYLCGRLWTGDV